jgi:hypothetical protein
VRGHPEDLLDSVEERVEKDLALATGKDIVAELPVAPLEVVLVVLIREELQESTALSSEEDRVVDVEDLVVVGEDSVEVLRVRPVLPVLNDLGVNVYLWNLLCCPLHPTFQYCIPEIFFLARQKETV